MSPQKYRITLKGWVRNAFMWAYGWLKRGDLLNA